MRWLRIASRISQDAKVWQIAEASGVGVHQVVGHLVALFGNMTEQAKDGDLSPFSDAMVEMWAEWQGRRGKFAPALRAALCDGRGVVAAWERYQGAAIREAEFDRRRADARRKSGKSPADGPADSPADGPTEVLRNDNEHETTRDDRADACLQPVRDAALAGDDGVVGTAIGDAPTAAVVLTSAINRGIRDEHGERLPIRHAGQVEAAQQILDAGVDVAWAREWIYHRARQSRPTNLPGSLAYFVRGVVKAWGEHQATQQAIAFDPPAGPRLLTDGAPRPERAERLSPGEQTRRASLEAATMIQNIAKARAMP